jgi:hypothetical protein
LLVAQGFAGLACLLVLAAEGMPAEVDVSWSAPPECPVQEEVVARVHARWPQRAAMPLSADAVVDRSPTDPTMLRLRLSVQGEASVALREIEARSCDALADAVATMLAFAATSATPPAATVEAPPRRSARTEPAEPAKTAREPSLVRDEEGREARWPRPPLPTPRTHLGAAAGVDHGAMPGTGATVAGELGLHWPRVRVQAFGLHAVGRRVSAGGVAARHRLTAGGMSVCVVAPIRAFDVGGCVAGELGAMHSRGSRERTLVGRRTLWAASTVGALAAWRASRRWSVMLRVDAVVPFVRRQFVIGDEVVGRIGPIGVRALAGVGVVLP